MKKILCVVVLFLFFKASGQNAEAGFDGKKWEAPYVLDTIKGWDVERFSIPISFAPSIPYKGVEDIRFTPGWARKTNNEYWSYAFLWYLDGTPALDAKTIENNLKAYYTGLIKVNTDSAKIADKLFAVTSSVKIKEYGKRRFENVRSFGHYAGLYESETDHFKYCDTYKTLRGEK